MPNVIWRTDGTGVWTERDGRVTAFAATDHATADCVGNHATNYSGSFEAIESIRRGVRPANGTYDGHVASGLIAYDDNGRQCTSCHFQLELGLAGHRVEPIPRALAERQRLHRALCQKPQRACPVGP